MGPALLRRPATEAVARKEPELEGLLGEVRRMAGVECLRERKTLGGIRERGGRGLTAKGAEGWIGEKI